LFSLLNAMSLAPLNESEKQLVGLIMANNIPGIQDHLAANPGVDINVAEGLHLACQFGLPKMLKVLLEHHGSDPNHKNRGGSTPFSICCHIGSTNCAKLLLKDERVDVNLNDDSGLGPLKWAAYGGHFDLLKWTVASGRILEVNVGDAETATMMGRPEVAEMVMKYLGDREQYVHSVRKELGIGAAIAAEVFVLVVMLCDGFLREKEAGEVSSRHLRTLRFFRIATQLPMELQKILCHRMARSNGDTVSRQDFEVVLRRVLTEFEGSQ